MVRSEFIEEPSAPGFQLSAGETRAGNVPGVDTLSIHQKGAEGRWGGRLARDWRRMREKVIR